MGIPVGLAWPATAVFCLLACPYLSRLVRLDYRRLGAGVREADLAGLLMTAAMAAMVSPVGAPVPVAGWQALFVVTACWFGVAVVRRSPVRNVCRSCDLHQAVGAAAMVYMLAAMPHGSGDGHGVWPVMVDSGAARAWVLPALALACAVYFAGDAAHAARLGLRARRARSRLPDGVPSRFGCRVVMGVGMSAMFAAGAAL